MRMRKAKCSLMSYLLTRLFCEHCDGGIKPIKTQAGLSSLFGSLGLAGSCVPSIGCRLALQPAGEAIAAFESDPIDLSADLIGSSRLESASIGSKPQLEAKASSQQPAAY